jgi:hypothetical protein
MKLPPLPAPPSIPEQLRNREFLRMLACDPNGRRQLESIRNQAISMRDGLLSQAAACGEVIESLTHALANAGTDARAERAH